ncbi:MAG: hypothetical protein H7287_12335 [Thermoleophilia bacterium]|nr:hypothetical protein [Thermoleophilia bacterium]
MNDQHIDLNVAAELALAHLEIGPAVQWPDANFDELATVIYDAQRGAVEVYDRWAAVELSSRAGEHAGVASWRDVPALPIAAFKQLPIYQLDSPVAALYRSSGTTAADRSTHRMQTLAHYDASLDAGVEAALVPDVVAGADPLACVQLQPSEADAPNSSLTHMYDRIRTGPWTDDRGAFVDSGFAIDAAGAWDALEASASEDRPVLLLTTSFALAMLLDAVEESGRARIQLPHGSRLVDTGGFKGRTREITREELLRRVGRWLGVAPEWCENEYGMSELSSQAWLGTIAAATGHPLTVDGVVVGANPREAGVRWTPPWLRVRVVDPTTLTDVGDGERGLLVFHDLANVWSCAAIRSEDIGTRRGSSFELVGRAPGAALKGCSLQLEDIT